MSKEALSKLLDGLSKFVAFLTIILYAVYAVNANWPFIATGTPILTYMGYAMYYAPFALVALVGLGFAVKRSFFVQLIMYVAIAGVTIFQFFPATWTSILSSFGA